MKSLWMRFFIALALLAFVVGFSFISRKPVASTDLGVVLRVIPQQAAGLFADPATAPQRYLGKEEKEWLPVDTEVVRQSYYPLSEFSARKKGLDVLRLGVVLAGADSRSLHRPEVCLPGQGWAITSEEIRKIPIANLGQVEVKVLHLQKEAYLQEEKRIVRAQYWYWWEGPKNRTSSVVTRTLLQMRESLFSNKVTRWAYPSVFGQFTLHANTEEELKEALKLGEDTMARALAQWAPLMLVRMGADSLSEEEKKQVELESIEPLEEQPL